MKNKISKILCMMLVMVMVMSVFGGCGSKETETTTQPAETTAEADTETSAETETKTITFPLEETVTFTTFSVKAEQYELSDNLALAAVEDMTNVDIEIAHSVSNEESVEKLNLLVASGDYPDVLFKPGQLQFDGYNKLLGRNDMEKIKHISIFVPRLLDGKKLDGTQEIPIFYLWIFAKSDIQSSEDYAFIRGNLLTFREMEEYKIYEDDEHIIYELHHLVYSDLRNYVEEMLIQNDSIYFNEEIWERIQRFYDTFSDREQLKRCIKPLDERYDRIPMTMDDVCVLSSKREELTLADLKPYSRYWEDIDYDKGHGISYAIDSDYELFYALEPNGELIGCYLYHNPTGDKIDIRHENVEEFVNTHGEPQPRCECTDTENGDHGWHLTLDWLIHMDKKVIISYIRHVCSYSIDAGDSAIYYYPLDDARFHVEIDWGIAAGSTTYRDENIWLIHDKTRDRCNVRIDDVMNFIVSHS